MADVPALKPLKHALTREDVIRIYNAEVAKKKSPKEAMQATRTEVHAALQLELPHPSKESEDEDPDVHWARQKIHGKNLWREADRLVSAAGITEGGLS